MSELIEKPMIFVFGSNEGGKHGAGAAKTARLKYGAVYGVGVGRTGNAYGIPTKDANIIILPLPKIQLYVNDFIVYAGTQLNEPFKVTAIGTERARYTHADMALLFALAPNNCWFDERWQPWLGERRYWGTYQPGDEE